MVDAPYAVEGVSFKGGHSTKNLLLNLNTKKSLARGESQKTISLVNVSKI